jgi:UDP-glucuronate decarboxylase
MKLNNGVINNYILEDLEKIVFNNLSWDKLRNKTVLITGITGMIGYYIALVLLYLNDSKNLNIKIIGISRSEIKIANKFKSILDRKDIQFLYQDITEPVNTTSEVHFLIHGASLTSPYHFSKAPIETIMTNVLGSENVLNLAVNKSVECSILLSTREIYGSFNYPTKEVDENNYGGFNPFETRACYPESKRLSETLFYSYMHQHKINTKVVRISHTYGPGMSLNDGRVVGDFISNAINREDIILKSDGKSEIGLTYISDVILGVFFVLLDSKCNLYNISNNSEIMSIKQLGEEISKMSEKSKVRFEIKTNNKSKDGYLKFQIPFLNSERAKKEGWNHSVPFKQGMSRTLNYFDNMKQIL